MLGEMVDAMGVEPMFALARQDHPTARMVDRPGVEPGISPTEAPVNCCSRFTLMVLMCGVGMVKDKFTGMSCRSEQSFAWRTWSRQRK